MGTSEVSQQMGDLFVQRCRVNLHTDILDTPDVFWEFDEFEPDYSKCRRYLEIHKRVNILNQRLEIVKDLYEMLHNEVTIRAGVQLEIIIIVLIVLEVLTEMLQIILTKRLWPLPGSDEAEPHRQLFDDGNHM